MHLNPEYALTILPHTNEDQVQVNGSLYQGSISYRGASLDQAKKLVDVSMACGQEVTYDCRNAPLYWEGANYVRNVAWIDKNGNKMNYWGNSRQDFKCECGVDGSCSSGSNYKCNCDKGDDVVRRDLGIVKDRRRLPITGIEVVAATGNQYRSVKVGRLVCSGKKLSIKN